MERGIVSQVLQISPSQISEVLTCRAKYYYHRIAKHPQKRGIEAMYGTAIDGAVERMLKDKMLGNILSPSYYAHYMEWEFLAQHPEKVAEDQVILSRLLQAAAVVDHYYREGLPEIEPMATQVVNKFECNEFRIHQIWDIVTLDDVIVDIKAPLKRFGKVKGEWQPKSPDHARQLYSYYRGFEAIHSYPPQGLELHYLMPPEQKIRVSHPPQIVRIKLDFDKIRDQAEEEIVRAWGYIQDAYQGNYRPNRSKMNFLCSTKWCPYWTYCEQEFKGKVRPGGNNASTASK